MDMIFGNFLLVHPLAKTHKTFEIVCKKKERER